MNTCHLYFKAEAASSLCTVGWIYGGKKEQKSTRDVQEQQVLRIKSSGAERFTVNSRLRQFITATGSG